MKIFRIFDFAEAKKKRKKKKKKMRFIKNFSHLRNLLLFNTTTLITITFTKYYYSYSILLQYTYKVWPVKFARTVR